MGGGVDVADALAEDASGGEVGEGAFAGRPPMGVHPLELIEGLALGAKLECGWLSRCSGRQCRIRPEGNLFQNSPGCHRLHL